MLDGPGIMDVAQLARRAVAAGALMFGLAALTSALALFMNTWWPILLLAPVLLIVRVFVIGPEERYLHRRFGSDYVAYMHRVRRWL